MAILINKETKIAIQGITGREASMVTKHMLDYGTKIIAGITPGKFGENVYGVPVYNTMKEACIKHEINTSIIYVPPAFVMDAVMEAVDNNLKFIVIITENIPIHDTVKCLYYAKKAGAIVVGPNTAGLINPEDRVKIGPLGGDNAERCFVPGSIGVISRSGGMTAETSWMIKRAGKGVTTSIGIGGDPLIGSSPKSLLALFEQDKKTEAVLMFSEPGTRFEEDVADFIKEGGFTKTLIAYVAGRFTEQLPEGTVFGHAGAIIEGGLGKPSIKIKMLREAGVKVAENYDNIIEFLEEL